ncbi:cyclic nucleotide-gated ion channel 1-like [Prunus avium]|uniref:Cyclic nucleotide-gated ion channel 1-like n=1 Tax=Prunus avium TaxID=42229 RepID=A0A6P5RGM4_PRUAV|nr:cyclic nucleotide-gated ion channel 1-like [Prunus avium]
MQLLNGREFLVSLDPLFFYIPIIDEKDKCLGIDKNLRTAALILRALPDATFALRTIISGYRIYTNEIDDWDGTLRRTYYCSFIGFVGILIAVSLMLPIPQLAIAVFYFKPGGSGHFSQRVTVSVFLIIYYLARVSLIYIFSTDNMYHARKWVRATLNLFFYILASHVSS